MHQPRILVVSGASRRESNVDAIVQLVIERATVTGAALRVADLARLRLPLFAASGPGQQDTQDNLEEVAKIREDSSWAEGFVLVTPEYHGNMSGALKNWFDFLYAELAGKFAGVIAVTGGGSGDMSIMAVKNCFAWCHGFTLPFHAAARAPDFDAQGRLANPKVIDRIGRIVSDVVRYAPVIHGAFEEARALGTDISAGVAGMHAGDEE